MWLFSDQVPAEPVVSGLKQGRPLPEGVQDLQKVTSIRLMIKFHSLTLRTLNYGICGILLIMGNTGFISSTVVTLKFRGLGVEYNC